MNALITSLNSWGERFLKLAGPMLWQSSLLILVLFALDLALRRKVRPAVRYALWLVLLVKLLLPPTLAVPTSIAWWIRPSPSPQLPASQFVVTYPNSKAAQPGLNIYESFTGGQLQSPRAKLSWRGWLLVGSSFVSLGLLTWMLRRWWQIARLVHRTSPATKSLAESLEVTRRILGLRRNVSLRFTEQPMSPAVCGLFRPVIILPQTLAEQLPPNQLRAVLLHELAHLKRGDVWVNCAQALLQVVYWWHPLLWLANVRIRRLREEAVDDAVMLALRDEAETYAPTLLQVAKLALNRPLASLGLVGIMECRSALRQRIERLINSPHPRHAGITGFSALGIVFFAATALPMGEGQRVSTKSEIVTNGPSSEWPDENFVGYKDVNLEAKFFRLDAMALEAAFSGLSASELPIIVPGAETTGISSRLAAAGARPHSEFEQLGFQRCSGFSVRWTIGGVTNNWINYLTRTSPPHTVAGVEVKCIANTTDWEPLEFTSTPWVEPDGVRCEVKLQHADLTNRSRLTEIRIPPGGAMLWALPSRTQPGKTEVVWLQHKPERGEFTPNVPATTSATATADPKGKVTVPGDEPAVGRVFSSESTTPLGTATNSEQLLVRRFKVDLNTFLKPLESTTTLPITRTNASATARDFFARLGVELNPPKSIFFNDRAGELLVRATIRDLETVEAAIQVLNTPAQQVNIKVQFVEIPVAEIRSLGFDWYPSNTVAQFSGILTEAQFRTVLRTLENRTRVDILTGPQVITVSGRQAQIQTVDILTVVKGINPLALTPPGITSTNSATNSVYLTETIPCGPVLDVIPTVEADGHTISMTVIPTVTEFLGYDKPASANKVPVYINGKKEWVTATPLPKFRTRQITTSARVWDGQTLVLGGFTASDSVRVKDKTPVLGDVPGVGSLFRSESRRTEKKNLIVFVTPTLVDPTGNRVHAEVQLPKSK